MVTYHCPHCNERLQVDDRRAGTAFVCSLCGKSTLVPGDKPAPPVPVRQTPPEQQAPTLRPVDVPQPPPARPGGGDLPAETRALRLTQLFEIEKARPLAPAEWMEASEHYRALGEVQLAEQMVQRATTAAGAAQGPQVTVINQNVATATTATVVQATPASNSDGSVGCGLMIFGLILCPLVAPLGVGLLFLGMLVALIAAVRPK